ncbi:hypothetical protein WJX74_010629 [Apatococcus lobatus]|uniref:Uncharacterized protein n=1 Tax=Apatococcus lobatus TaxID=904363 RepID=A0AAW1QCS4_9CHLO
MPLRGLNTSSSVRFMADMSAEYHFERFVSSTWTLDYATKSTSQTKMASDAAKLEQASKPTIAVKWPNFRAGALLPCGPAQPSPVMWCKCPVRTGRCLWPGVNETASHYHFCLQAVVESSRWQSSRLSDNEKVLQRTCGG